jgi:hypothetical protein
MNHVRGPLIALSSAAMLVAFAACSSIPAFRFDDDAGSDAGNGGTDGGPPEGGDPDGSFSCPLRPPPQGVGECCSQDLCLKCSTQQDCNECRREDCQGPQVCCKTGAGSSSVTCRPQAACQ